MLDVRSILSQNLSEVRGRIADSCCRCGRPLDDVTLVAVTKYVDIETAHNLYELGQIDLAESRPQELWSKSKAIPAVQWHQVGHLQRNKVEKTLPVAGLIHSVDSLRLLDAIEKEAARQNRTTDILLELNLSGEREKDGFGAEDAAQIVEYAGQLKSTRILGLMTMAARAEQPEAARPTFVALRELRDEMAARIGPPHELTHLSMGMTQDFEIAIEEGATLVRIGSALFEGLRD